MYVFPKKVTNISSPFEGELNRDGGLFNLEKMMVPALHKKQRYKVETLKYKKLEVMQQRIRIKSELRIGK